LFTGKVVKSSAQAYLQHLNAHYPKGELPDFFHGMAAATEDASDARYQRWRWRGHATHCACRPDGDDMDRIEGRIWTHLR
jgi:hypothetical protein